jgi:acetyl esterase/lipase
MRFIFTVIFLFYLSLVAFSQTINLDSSNVRHNLDIFYTKNEDSLQSLDVYWNGNSKSAGVLVFVHGGGWLSGDKKQYRKMAANLASNGITVVLINYRLSPKVKFPAHTEDVAAAIHWTSSFIDKYNGDKENIYLMGHSAGAHLISLLVCDEKYLGKYELMPEDVAGAITISGVFEIKPQEGGATKKYLGMVFGDNERIWETASCKKHIDTTTKHKIPPFLISWGKEEEKLIVDESLNFIDVLKESEIKFQSYTFSGRDHYTFRNDLKDVKSNFFKQVMQFMLITSTTLKANDMIDSLKKHIEKKEADKIIKLILNNPEILDKKDENGSSGLFLIAYSGMETAFNKAKELKKSFVFHEAIVCGKIDFVKDSLAHDKNYANQYSNDGFTPLSLAAFFNQTEISKLLLENGADPNLHATNPSKVNALHSAVAKENYELCKLLIEYGVNVNAPQMQNVTALHSATHRGNLKLVRLLVESGAEINLKMDNGDTAISIAENDGHKEVKVYLESISK